MYEHVKYVLLSWLNLNGYRGRNKEFEQLAFSHPDFPSIQAVVDALAEMKIECLAVSVPKEALEELDANILVYISDGKHEQLAIFRGWDKDKIVLIVDSNLTIYLSKEDFLKNWNGTVVAIEANSTVDRVVDFKSLLGKVEFIVSLFFVVGISVLLITTRGQLYSILSFMLSILGLFICTQIVKHELGVKTGILKKVCTLTPNSSCDAVLNSPASKLFGVLGLGDIGFSYFAVLSFMLFMVPDSTSQLLPIITMLAAPFSLFSIWYQWRIVKKWCPLCLSVIGVVLMMFANSLILNFSNIFVAPHAIDAIKLISLGILVMGIYLAVKSYLGLGKVVQEYSLNLLRFKRDYHLFLPFFYTQREIDVVRFPGDICIGNDSAGVEILAITNPMCSTCLDAHKMYESILAEYALEVKFRLRFYVPYESREDIRTKVAERLIDLNKDGNNSLFEEALNDWYNTLNENWLVKWGVSVNVKNNIILKQQKMWCENNDIDSTPAIIINGRLFPTIYSPLDLKYMIREIVNKEKESIIKKVDSMHLSI